MSAATAVASITQAELALLPAVLAGVQIAEASGAPGDQKYQAVIQALGSASPGISALVNLAVGILNSLGAFRHKTTNVSTMPQPKLAP